MIYLRMNSTTTMTQQFSFPRTSMIFILLVQLIWLQGSKAWLSSSSPNTHHRHNLLQQSTTRLYTTTSSSSYNNDDNNHNNNNEQEFSVLTSRRQWLQGMVVAATATATTATAMSSSTCLPANAAEVVKAPSVCDPTVSIWKKDGRIVYLLGTAHISASSAELAGRLVQDIHPTGVFVELDPKRVKGSGILAQRVNLDTTDEEGNSSSSGGATTTVSTAVPTSKVIVPNIQQLVASAATTSTASSSSELTSSSAGSVTNSVPSTPSKQPGPFMRIASVAVGKSIQGMYKRLDSSGFKAGEEFTVAIREGQKIGSDIVLGDRDVEVTLNRLAEGISKTDLSMLLNPDSELEQSLKELFPDTPTAASRSKDGTGMDLTDEEFREEFTSFVELMKTKDNVKKIMVQLQKTAPFLYEALVSERDAYMAAGLNGLNELETIVAVMGIAHVDGVETNLKMNGWSNVTPTCA